MTKSCVETFSSINYDKLNFFYLVKSKYKTESYQGHQLWQLKGEVKPWQLVCNVFELTKTWCHIHEPWLKYVLMLNDVCHGFSPWQNLVSYINICIFSKKSDGRYSTHLGCPWYGPHFSIPRCLAYICKCFKW